jgi:hypothetical protein
VRYARPPGRGRFAVRRPFRRPFARAARAERGPGPGPGPADAARPATTPPRARPQGGRRPRRPGGDAPQAPPQ